MNVIDLLEEMGVQPKRIAASKGGEYHSRCPDSRCDGKDRFCVWPKEGADGRYWCRKCLRCGDAIQFCRDFMGMDFLSACEKIGRQPNRSIKPVSIASKERFTPKLLMPPSYQWCQKASDFIQRCHQYLLIHPDLLNMDKNRGLTQQSIVDFQLGWNPLDTFEPRLSWGLPDMSLEGGSRFLCLPQGIVIPSFREDAPIRVKIRRHKWKPDDKYPKYHIVAGGMTYPSVYGDTSKPIVIVEAELDAMLIQGFAADLCCCIALGGVSIRPDIVINNVLLESSCVLFALDFDEAGKNAYHFWRSNYKQLKPWPVPRGKSPGDAYQEGVSLRSWVLAGIHK